MCKQKIRLIIYNLFKETKRPVFWDVYKSLNTANNLIERYRLPYIYV